MTALLYRFGHRGGNEPRAISRALYDAYASAAKVCGLSILCDRPSLPGPPDPVFSPGLTVDKNNDETGGRRPVTESGTREPRPAARRPIDGRARTMPGTRRSSRRISHRISRQFPSGFTLIELMIVIVILGILAAVATPQFANSSSEARRSSVLPMCRSMGNQLQVYRLQHGDVLPDLGAGSAGGNRFQPLTGVTV